MGRLHLPQFLQCLQRCGSQAWTSWRKERSFSATLLLTIPFMPSTLAGLASGALDCDFVPVCLPRKCWERERVLRIDSRMFLLFKWKFSDDCICFCYLVLFVACICSFDIVRDTLGLVRTEFPHQVYFVAGTQVSSFADSVLVDVYGCQILSLERSENFLCCLSGHCVFYCLELLFVP